MAVVTLAAAKGSPGVTTAALVLGAAWPSDREVVVADIDVGGGAIGGHFGLPPTPGLTTLTAEHGRRGMSDGGLLVHCQRLPGGLPVIVAPPSPTAVLGALHVLGAELQLLAETAGVDLLVDAGRLVVSDSPGRLVNGSLAVSADVVALLVRPTLAGLAPLASMLSLLRANLAEAETRVLLLLAGSGGYPAEEIAAHFRVPVVGTLPTDSAAAAVATGHAGGRLERTRLFHAARSVAADLVSRATTRSGADQTDAALAQPVEVAP